MNCLAIPFPSLPVPLREERQGSRRVGSEGVERLGKKVRVEEGVIDTG